MKTDRKLDQLRIMATMVSETGDNEAVAGQARRLPEQSKYRFTGPFGVMIEDAFAGRSNGTTRRPAADAQLSPRLRITSPSPSAKRATTRP